MSYTTIEEAKAQAEERARSRNPAAFPTPAHNLTNDGMTLRDYFAAKAMQSYLMLEATQEVLGDELVSPKQYCALFYQWADAMLKARQQ